MSMATDTGRIGSDELLAETALHAGQPAPAAIAAQLRSDIVHCVIEGGQSHETGRRGDTVRRQPEHSARGVQAARSRGISPLRAAPGVSVAPLRAEEAREIRSYGALLEVQALGWALSAPKPSSFDAAQRNLAQLDNAKTVKHNYCTECRIPSHSYEPAARSRTLALIENLRFEF